MTGPAALPRPRTGGNPKTPLRVFAVASLAGMAALVAGAGVGVHRVYYDRIVRHAEISALGLGQAVYEREREALNGLRSDPPETLAIRPEDLPDLDRRLRRHLAPLEILQITLYARDGTVAYSTDAALIGRGDPGNARLGEALRGIPSSTLETRERVWDVAGEELHDVDVVETYLPLRDRSRVVGGLSIHTDVTWSRDEVRRVLRGTIVVVTAVQLGVFSCLLFVVRGLTRRVENAQRELEAIAATDSLTALGTRRHLMARAAEEFAKVRRGVEPGLGVVMADIDHFKRVNDSHGHAAGDAVLRGVADLLRQNCRGYDLVGRYGGEEFLLVLPGADVTRTRAVAERARRCVREARFEGRDGPVQVTMSFGIACVQPGDPDIDTAIARADRALYQAKQGGRDRVAGL